VLPSAKKCKFNQPKAPKIPNSYAHVDQERNISSVAESKVNKGIAGIGAIKKSEKS